MEVQELRKVLETSLNKQLVGSNIMSHFCFITEDSKKTSAFGDPRYVPFYYYLGKHIAPRNLLEIGFRLGLLSGAFLESCRSVEYFLAYQESTGDFYSPRMASKNVKRNHKKKPLEFYFGQIEDETFLEKLSARKWDLVIVNEEKDYDRHMFYLDLVWEHMNLGGHIVMDYVKSHDLAARAFQSFCKTKNREPIIFSTRYGTGLVVR